MTGLDIIHSLIRAAMSGDATVISMTFRLTTFKKVGLLPKFLSKQLLPLTMVTEWIDVITQDPYIGLDSFDCK